jgi:hypothetical protein
VLKAIYVFCIVPNYVEWTTTLANMTFTLDGRPAGIYFHTPIATSSEYQYNVTVYTETSLENAQHTLKVEAQAGTSSSYIAFDYALYT